MNHMHLLIQFQMFSNSYIDRQILPKFKIIKIIHASQYVFSFYNFEIPQLLEIPTTEICIYTYSLYIYEFEHLKVGMGGVPLKQSQSWRLGRLEAGGPEARTQPEGGTGHTSNAEARWRIISCVIYNIYIYMCDI